MKGSLIIEYASCEPIITGNSKWNPAMVSPYNAIVMAVYSTNVEKFIPSIVWNGSSECSEIELVSMIK